MNSVFRSPARLPAPAAAPRASCAAPPSEKRYSLSCVANTDELAFKSIAITDRKVEILFNIKSQEANVSSFFPALFIRSFALVALISLAACNPPQPLNFSVQNVQVSPVVADADLRGITVT